MCFYFYFFLWYYFSLNSQGISNFCAHTRELHSIRGAHTYHALHLRNDGNIKTCAQFCIPRRTSACFMFRISHCISRYYPWRQRVLNHSSYSSNTRQPKLHLIIYECATRIVIITTHQEICVTSISGWHVTLHLDLGVAPHSSPHQITTKACCKPTSNLVFHSQTWALPSL